VDPRANPEELAMPENLPPDPDDHGDEHKSGLGKRLLGLFVEREAPGAAEDGPEIVLPKAVPSAPEPAPAPRAEAPAAAPAVAAAGAPAVAPARRPTPPPSYKPPDFAGILKTAGLPEDDRDRLAKTEELLRNLPPETPLPLKRQIVEGTLRTFGIAPEKLVAAAGRAGEALGTYLRIGEDDLKERTAATEKRLAELRAEQERLAAALAERRAMQQVLEWDVRQRQGELRAVVDFFGGPRPAPKPGT
jgi:hypothetical protein